jgi:hypothetical protein
MNDLRKIFELNQSKIRVELAKKDKSFTWLAEEIGMTRQAFSFSYKTKSIKHVPAIAQVFGLTEADLLTAKANLF